MNGISFSTAGRAALLLAIFAAGTACTSASPTPSGGPSAAPPTFSPTASPQPPTPSPAPSPTTAPSPSSAPTATPSPSAPVSANPVAVFDVAGETFRIELIGAANLAHAQALLGGTGDGPIPSGLLVLGDAGINAPWSWHVDPTSLEWADVTTEVCDGTPSQIEDGTFTYERFCPWSAKLTAIEVAR